GVLTSRVRRQEMRIRKREERTHALYSLTKELSEVNGVEEVKSVVLQGVERYFKSVSMVLLPDEINGKQPEINFKFTPDELKAIKQCFEQSVKCGRFTDIYPDQTYSFFPLVGTQMKIGVLVLKQTEQFTYGEEQFWDAYLGQVTGKFEREILRSVARKAYLLDESDKLYKTLFNSISHELRIPVTAIMGASDTLITEKYPEKVQQELLSEINIASVRLNHLIENLLNMSRLESGRLSLRYDWCDVHDLINRVTETLHQELHPFSVNILIPDDLPMVKLDFGLMEQVIHNLLLNATQYAPPKSVISVEFGIENNVLKIAVSDNGPGFPEEELTSVFDKFYRGKSNRTGGTGLGLSIARGFVEAHKGNIMASNNSNGGAQFIIHIPIEISTINSLNLNT
ncbi:MAG TPA: ATP-binding protein, partial [Paludibacter sp.]|nr:ATP-binding protein [Paludibacter sp.]